MSKALQAATGLLFAAFVSVHLLNTWLASFGPEVYDGVQRALRAVYQFAPLEALLLSALVVHLAIGLWHLWRGPKRALNTRARLHRYAGIFLALVIAGHILAVRGASWFYDVYPEFIGLAFSIDALPGYFYPYYFLLSIAGFYHALNGTGIALQRFGIRRRLTDGTLKVAAGIAAVLTGAALLAFGGVWTDVGDPAHSAFGQLALEIVSELAP